jgi:hypothetical protein
MKDVGAWKDKSYDCTHKCGTKIHFRWSFKNIQHKDGLNWVAISKHAAIVICNGCGNSFWIPAELENLAEL